LCWDVAAVIAICSILLFIASVNQILKDQLFPPDIVDQLKVEVYAGAIYDAIFLYAIALNETLSVGGHKKDGKSIVSRMMSREFEGKVIIIIDSPLVTLKINHIFIIT